MQLDLPTAEAANYKSPSQRARVATEAWASRNLYCPNCEENSLESLPPNTPSIDYVCGACKSTFQLKSQGSPLSFRIVDAAYDKMCEAVRLKKTPNLFVVQYDKQHWSVSEVVLVPHFAFSMSVIEKRKPLGTTARRAGWVGCNILLGRIPVDARVAIVTNGNVSEPSDVREQYASLRPLEGLTVENRGWTLDVLNEVRALGKGEFTLSEIYASEPSLSRIYPHNHHVRDKIRQQLQVLRDLGLVKFLGRGNYHVVGALHSNP
jgi:type II restriction enzyme